MTVYVIELSAGRLTPVSSMLPEPLGSKAGGGRAGGRGGPGVAGEVRTDLGIGDRGPGHVARAGIADHDRVGQRLAGRDDCRPCWGWNRPRCRSW